MRLSIFLLTFIFFSSAAIAQIDPALLRRTAKDTSGLLLNMDAVYNRPFLQLGKLPVALGVMQKPITSIYRKMVFQKGISFK